MPLLLILLEDKPMNFTERAKPSTTISLIHPENVPYVAISRDALNKMYLYTKECTDEIGWLGTVEYLRDDNCYYITDTYLFEQQVHSTTTEITPEGLAKFGEQLLMQPDGVEIWNSIRMWGHSHVNMAVNPSGQDDSQMLQFGKNGNDYFIRLICNKKGELRVDVYDYDNNIAYKDLQWYVHEPEEVQQLLHEIERLESLIEAQTTQAVKELEVGIKGEIKEKVSKLVYASKGGYLNLGSKSTTTSYKPTKSTVKKVEDKWNQWGTWPEWEDEFEYSSTGNDVLTSGANYFRSDDEVFDQFNDSDLLEFATCNTRADLMSILRDMGFYAYFTEEDVTRIQNVAGRYFK